MVFYGILYIFMRVLRRNGGNHIQTTNIIAWKNYVLKMNKFYGHHFTIADRMFWNGNVYEIEGDAWVHFVTLLQI